MSSCTRLFSGLVLTSLLTTSTFAQTKRTQNASADPFSIKAGVSFSAWARPEGERSSPTAATTRLSSAIAEAEEVIRNNFMSAKTVTDAEMTKSALEGALRSLDPHSNFYDQREWKDLMDEERSGYSGIGATIASFSRGGVADTYVLSTFPGSPAARAQLKFGDRIVAVDGQSVSGKGPDAVRDKLRGLEGTAFRLTVERATDLHQETFEIRRGRVSQPSIPSWYMLRSDIGYVQMSEGFSYTTANELDSSLRDLKRQGMRSLVLDLRGNGGGIVDQAVQVAEKFLPAGTLILSQRGRARYDNRVWRSGNTNPETMPLVLLVDEDTASASEIVAGALQDNDRALIVGEKTFGKGLVQSVIDLPGRTGLTLTTARYLTPTGRSIQRDYSKLDNYDYFSHKTAAIDTAYFEARTITNRRVLGGDGILPDEVVKSPEMTPAQSALLDPLFFFARDLVNGRIRGGGSYRPIAYSSTDEAAGMAINNVFEAYLRANPDWTRFVPGSDIDFVAGRVRYYATMADLGSGSADRVLSENDPQLLKAIQSMQGSAQLATLADSARRQRR